MGQDATRALISTSLLVITGHGDAETNSSFPVVPALLFLYVVSGFSRTYLNPVTALVPDS